MKPTCPTCDGAFMLPGMEPDDDVFNTPCPDCNPQYSREFREAVQRVWEECYPDRRPWGQLTEDAREEWLRVFAVFQRTQILAKK